MKIPHPIQYQGSKRILAPIILEYFPSNIGTLIEPFAGTAAISVAAAQRNYANKYLINDLNAPLIELLKSIVNKPEETSDYYEKIWSEQHDNSIKHYNFIREKFNKSKDPNLFLYLLSRCAKGSVRYNKNGYLNQSPDKRRKGTIPQTMRKNIFGVSILLKEKAIFSSLDYRLVLQDIAPIDLIYMDPPYQGVCGDKDSRYYCGINFDEFTETLDDLNKRNISYIISYDGKTGDRKHGKQLSEHLGLVHIEINAGRSTQATLLGKNEITYESLYLSPAAIKRINKPPLKINNKYHIQLTIDYDSCHV